MNAYAPDECPGCFTEERWESYDIAIRMGISYLREIVTIRGVEMEEVASIEDFAGFLKTIFFRLSELAFPFYNVV